MPKSPEYYIQNPNEKWKLSEESTIELVSSLDEAVKSKNSDEIKKILSDPQKVRKLLIDRSEKKGKNLIVLKNSFDQLFLERFGKEADIYSVSSEKMLDWIHNIGLPEYILNDMMAAAYHLKSEQSQQRFFRLLTIISENESRLRDKTVLPRALHDWASWESMARGNPQRAIDLNKNVLGSARVLEDKVLEQKALFGISYNKYAIGSINAKEKTRDFEKYAEKLSENGNEYDSINAIIEAASAYLSLARLQVSKKINSFRLDNLDKAEKMAQGALGKAKSLGYSNATIKASRVLSGIYKEMGELKQYQYHLREANKAKRKTGYRN